MRYLTSVCRFLLGTGLLLGLLMWTGPTALAQSCTIAVDDDGGADYSNLANALRDANSGSVVCVAEGTYNPPSRNTPLTMPAGAELKGGYPADFSSQDVQNNPTFLDGSLGGSSAKRVLTVSTRGNTSGVITTVDGFTIRNGQAKGNPGAGFGVSGYDGTITIRDLTFSSNSTNKDGAGLYLDVNRAELRNTAFIANEADGQGGGAYIQTDGELVLEGVLAKGNRAQGEGGGLHVSSGGGRIVNATVSGNSSGAVGGGLYLTLGSDMDGQNTIVWNNAAAASSNQLEIVDNGGTVTWRHSALEGSGGSGAWDSAYGTDDGDNFALNPFFVTPSDPSAAPTASGNLRLANNSPAIDAGDNPGNIVSIEQDLDGEDRFQGDEGIIDLGAYEGGEPLPPPEILYVDAATGSDSNSGESWDQAFSTLRFALDVAGTNTEIWVADGVYYPDEQGNEDLDEATSTFDLKKRVNIYGGFAGNESSRSERDPDANLVVLSGDIGQDDATNADGIVTAPSDQNNGRKNNLTNAFHVVDGSGVSSRTVVDGVTITAGSADDKKNKDERPDEVGGGVFVNDGSPTLSDVRIIGNRAKLDGGGVASYGGGGPVLSETVVESNAAQRNGGGVYNSEGSGLRVRFVTLRGNTAVDRGGGIYNDGANVRFTNVTVEGNEATSGTGRGGGVATVDSKGSVFTNLEVVGNRAAQGGGFYNGSGSSTTNLGTATFSGNYATNQGSGIFTGNEDLNLTNSIVWGNGPDQVNGDGPFSQQASLIEGGLDGAVNEDPQFISDPTVASSGPTTDGDLQLQPGSPAADLGDTSLLPSDVSDIDDDGDTNERLPLDLAGSQRVKDNSVDAGAYEGTSLDLVVEGTLGADGTDKGWRDMGLPVTGAAVEDVERRKGEVGLENISRWGVWRDINDTWTRLSATDLLPAGRGFTVYLFDKNESAIDPSLTFTTTAGSRVGQNDVTVGDETPAADGELAQSAQFHFLANPYGVPYDLIRLEDSGNLNGFQTIVQIWDYKDGYQLVDLTNDNTGITAWQAFYIERTTIGEGPTQLTFPSEGRLPDASNTNPFFGSKTNGRSEQAARVPLTLTAEDTQGNEVLRDEAARVLFHPNASGDWDRYDASKLTPPTNKYAVIGPVGQTRGADSTMKAQESRSLPSDGSVEVPVGLEVKNYTGPLTLSLGETVDVPEDWTITLVDTKGTADPADDTEHTLQESGSGYQFRFGKPKAAHQRATPDTATIRQERPPRARTLDWQPPGTSTGSTPRTKSERSGDAPEARFRLRISDGQTLPVELAGFDATLDGKQAQLHWTTASESQNAGFRVQHQRLAAGDSTADREDWSSLGFVEGAGNSSRTQEYRFDTEPLKHGTHVFRLSQVDESGETHVSDPVRVKLGLDEEVAIDGPNPNPVRQGATLNLTVGAKQEVAVQIYDVLGRQVRAVSRGTLPGGQTRTVRIDTDGLTSGTYLLRIEGDQFRRTRRMTVVR